MIQNFGCKFDLDPEKIIHILYRLLPPLAFILGGIGIAAWTVSDYYDMVDFGMYDEAFMEKSLRSGLITAGILLVAGILLLLVLNIIYLLYKTGYFSIWGFSYNEETKMLSVHKYHKKREFYIGDLVDIKISNTGLDINGNFDAVHSRRKTPYGYIRVYFRVNGKTKKASPYGMIGSVEGAAYEIMRLYQKEVASKQEY